MSDTSQGPGWWQASDSKWYPPEQAAQAPPGPPPSPEFAAPTSPPPGYGPPPGDGSLAGADPAYGGQSYGGPGSAPAFGAPGGGAGQLAEWPVRVASYAIDFIAVAVVANLVSIVISSALGTLLSLVGLAFGLYNAYLNGSTGQSVGKRIMGTKVVGEATGQPIGGGLGIVRYLAHFVDAIICFIGFLFPLWDPKKQTIADKIMKTVVITGQPKQSFGDAIKPS